MTSEMTQVLESLASEGDLQSMLKLSPISRCSRKHAAAELITLTGMLALLESDDSLGVWSRKVKSL